MFPGIGNSFTSSFPIWMPLISFTSLVAPARVYITMFNKMVRTDIPIMFLILGRKHPDFQHSACHQLKVFRRCPLPG